MFDLFNLKKSVPTKFLILLFLLPINAIAENMAGFSGNFPIPTLRQSDGAPLEKSEIKSFVLYVVDDNDVLTEITPRIDYDGTSDLVEFTNVVVAMATPEGDVDFCVKTVDKNDRIASTCSTVKTTAFVVNPPEPPDNLNVWQSLSVNLDVSITVN